MIFLVKCVETAPRRSLSGAAIFINAVRKYGAIKNLRKKSRKHFHVLSLKCSRACFPMQLLLRVTKFLVRPAKKDH